MSSHESIRGWSIPESTDVVPNPPDTATIKAVALLLEHRSEPNTRGVITAIPTNHFWAFFVRGYGKIFPPIDFHGQNTTGGASAPPESGGIESVSHLMGEPTMADMKEERHTLEEILLSRTPLGGENGFPSDFDYRGALMRAFDFFADDTPEGKLKQKELLEKIEEFPFSMENKTSHEK